MNLELLKGVVIDQKEELGKTFKRERIIPREKLSQGKKFMKTDLIKVITGVRRSGKSVFSTQLLENENYGYVNFDDERIRGLKSEDLNDVLKAFYEVYGDVKFIFLDEIQNVDGWELFVNRLRRLGANIIITGSNANLLSKELATHLTGRFVQIELFPFSFREFLNYNNVAMTKESFYSTRESSLIKKQLRDYLKIGGFPEAVKEREISKTYLATLYSTILTKDVIVRQNIKLKNIFNEISNYIISNFASEITYNKIKNIFNLKSSHTAANYVSYLEEAYLIFTINKFSYKYKEVQRSPKKVYGIDTGMIDSVGFRVMENIGKLMENAVAVELKRRYSGNPKTGVFYWKDYSGKEVDFVIKQGIRVNQLIQVCRDVNELSTKKREVEGALKAMSNFKLKQCLIITEDFEGEEIVDKRKVKYIPLWKWLLQR